MFGHLVVGHGGPLSGIGFGSGERFDGAGDGLRREFEIEIRDLEIIERLAVSGQFELAGDEAGLFQLLQVQMQQRPADPDFARQLADIIAPVRLQRRDDPLPRRTGKRRQNGQQLVSNGRQAAVLPDMCK
jgi:hypothetical protein